MTFSLYTCFRYSRCTHIPASKCTGVILALKVAQDGNFTLYI